MPNDTVAPDATEQSFAFMREDLKRSGLTTRDIAVTPLPHATHSVPAYRIHYPVYGDGGMYRDRRQGKDPKYLGPAGVTGAWWKDDQSCNRWTEADFKLVVEGEKKAAAGQKHLGWPGLGLGGCYGFSRGGSFMDELKPGLAKGVVVIVFDGDVLNNIDVARAAGTLARAVSLYGGRPEVVELPYDDENHRMGLDDWIVAQGDVSQAVLRERFKALPRISVDVLPEAVSWMVERLGLHYTETEAGKINIEKNDHNTRAFLVDWLGGEDRIFFDQYAGPLILHPKRGMEPLNDAIHDSELLQAIERKIRRAWARDCVRSVRRSLAASTRKNLTGDWLRGLRWDGKKRIDTMMQRIWGSKQDPKYLAAAGVAFMVGAVNRCLDPGSKNDFMVIFEGAQGQRKTHSIETLFGEERTSIVRHPKESDLVRVSQRSWCILFDELSVMTRYEFNAMKSWLSQRQDTHVAKYVESAEVLKRAFVHVGTTNESKYLDDLTGNRRYIPVSCEGEVNVGVLEQEREQLWAEAVHLYKTGVAWWKVEKIAGEEQESRRRSTPWEERLREVLATARLPTVSTAHGPVPFFTSYWALQQVGARVDTANSQTAAGQALGKLYEALGYERMVVKPTQIMASSFAAVGEGSGSGRYTGSQMFQDRTDLPTTRTRVIVPKARRG